MDDRHAGVDALQDFRPPGIVEIDLAAGRLEADETAAAKGETPAAAGNRCRLQAGIAGQLVGDLVPDFARHLVEGDNAAAVTIQPAEGDAIRTWRAASDHDQEQVPFDDRRAPDAEEILHDAKILERVDLPDLLPFVRRDTAQHPLHAIGVDPVAIDDGGAAGAVVVAVLVLVIGIVLVPPQFLAGLSIQGVEPGLVLETVEL